LSGPGDFDGSNSFKSLGMPEIVISIVEMSGYALVPKSGNSESGKV